MTTRWYNYSDEELIDFAMDENESLSYELARRFDEAKKEIDSLMGKTKSHDGWDEQVEELKSEVFMLENQVERLKARLSDNLPLIQTAIDLTQQVNQLLNGNQGKF